MLRVFTASLKSLRAPELLASRCSSPSIYSCREECQIRYEKIVFA